MRRDCIGCLLVLSLGFAPASARDTPKQPFIVRTHVIAPLEVGDFVLEGSRYDPANKLAGVAIRYFLPGREETRIDLFVYPHGQADGEAALDHGMEGFRATLEAAEQAGYYRGLTVADAIEFDIPLPSALPGAAEPTETPAEPPPAPAAEPDPAQAGRIAMLAGLLGEGRHVDGRMIELAYDSPGQAEGEWLPMRSRGYPLYRHLYFFKGRVSAAEPRIDAAAFAALADRAMRELVPAVQAYNIGSCADTEITLDVNLPAEDVADMFMRQLVAAQTRGDASNCHAEPDTAELAALANGAEVVAIDYAPGDWGGN